MPDTVWVQYLALSPRRSSLALYSGTGSALYYDFNTDRERADAWLRAQSIRRPDRWSAMVVPSCV